jgi:L-rhamnonate dehydratase
MDRRAFFAAAAAGLGALPLLSSKVQAVTKSANLKITAIEIWRYTGDPEQQKAYQIKEGLGTTRDHRPMPLSQLYMRILTSEKGVEGFYGTFEQTSADAAMAVARSLVGMDPLATEAISERLRGSHTHSGYHMFGASTIDNCLWDLKGKLLDLPVYRLLGGSRNVIDCYASLVSTPVKDLNLVRTRAAQIKKEGFTAQKWFPQLGPQDGDAGFEQNVALVRTLRETLGEYYTFMIDVLGARWNIPYAIRWCKAVEQYRPYWLEEVLPAPPGQVEGYARLRQETSMLIAAGEHNYGRWEVNDLIKANAIDVVQVDPEWGGGITELLKICALASTYGLIVSPHNQRTIALAHLIASQPVNLCPILEYQINVQPNLAYFEKNPLVPKNSKIELPDLPGFGIEIDESRIVKREKLFPAA